MFKSVDVILVSDVSKNAVINLLLKNNISILKCQTTKGGLLLNTPRKERTILIALFRDMCYNYQIINTHGLSARVNELVLRRGLIVGLCFAFALFLIAPHCVTDIKVNASNDIKNSIIKTLADEGVYEGRTFVKVDCDRLQTLVAEIDGVAFVEVEKKGTVVNVTVLEELASEDIYSVTSGGTVVAAVDAVVSRQIVYSGTPLFTKGAVVKAGQPLIEGYYLVGEQKVETAASGEVYGLVYYTSSAVFTEQTVISSPTGRQKRYTKVSFLGVNAAETVSPFERYSVTRTVSEKGLFFPIMVETITYIELEDITIMRTFEQAEAALYTAALEGAREQAPSSARITGEWVTVNNAGDIITVTATVQAEIRIDGGA